MVASTRGGVRLCPRKTAKFSGSPSTVIVLSSTSSSIAMIVKNNFFSRRFPNYCVAPAHMSSGRELGGGRREVCTSDASSSHTTTTILTRFLEFALIITRHYYCQKFTISQVLLNIIEFLDFGQIIIRHYDCQKLTMLTKFHKFYLISQC